MLLQIFTTTFHYYFSLHITIQREKVYKNSDMSKDLTYLISKYDISKNHFIYFIFIYL